MLLLGSSTKKRRSVHGTLHPFLVKSCCRPSASTPIYSMARGQLRYVILHYQTAVSLASNNLLNRRKLVLSVVIYRFPAVEHPVKERQVIARNISLLLGVRNASWKPRTVGTLPELLRG